MVYLMGLYYNEINKYINNAINLYFRVKIKYLNDNNYTSVLDIV